MASRLFTRSPNFLLGLAGASVLALHPASPISVLQQWRRPLLCDSFAQPTRTPLLKSGTGSRGGLNPTAVRQISLGSVLGLASGVAIGTFSKSLAIIFGVFIITVQFVESKLGIRVIPRERLQQWFKDIDIKKLVDGNVPFKVSYGAALLLAGWGRFSEI